MIPVADLIDNSISIAAGARNVDVTLNLDTGNFWLRITDDGRGMNGTAITDAIKYGASRDYDDEDLARDPARRIQSGPHCVGGPGPARRELIGFAAQQLCSVNRTGNRTGAASHGHVSPTSTPVRMG